jgi:hypothetical protein
VALHQALVKIVEVNLAVFEILIELSPGSETLSETAKAFVKKAGPKAELESTRDTSVNLSDSRSGTHQHWPPAGASCCHSLPLDPDVMIGIDLHKRLFLLVTGRGE